VNRRSSKPTTTVGNRSKVAIRDQQRPFLLLESAKGSKSSVNHRRRLPEMIDTLFNRVPEIHSVTVIGVAAEHGYYEKVIRVFECVRLGRI